MNRYLYARKVVGDSGRAYKVSFDTARRCWMCSCLSCTRRQETCKHLIGLGRRGPDSLQQDMPEAGCRCPICCDDRLNHEDLVIHIGQEHPRLLEWVGAEGRYVCACGYYGSIRAMVAHIEKHMDDLHAHFAEGVMLASAGRRGTP